MFKHSRKKTISIISLSFLVLSGVLFLQVINSLSDYLSKTERVNANILLVEGWLRPDEIEMAYNEFLKHGYSHIITTGLKSPEYYMISMNGYLIFYPKRKISKDNESHVHVIEVDGYSELGSENSSRFNVFINDSMIADFLAEKRKENMRLHGKEN